MPQMSPLWWSTLMLMFNLTLLLISTNIYFNSESYKTLKMKKKNKKMNWKW